MAQRPKRMARKPLPKNVTVKQQLADIQAGKSERAGHAMIKRNPPKTSVRTWLRSKLAIGEPSFGLSKEERAKMGRLRRETARGKRRPATRGGSRR